VTCKCANDDEPKCSWLFGSRALPEEMKQIYGSQRLDTVATHAFKQYAEDYDQLFLTVSMFVSRILRGGMFSAP
jgi:hypothetical protein